MKNFNDLTKKELSELNSIQVDAYIDIELANKGIVKPIVTNIDFPEFVAFTEKLPERDVTVYEVDGYTFPDLESAEQLANLIGTLSQVSTDYNYNVGSEFRYVKNPMFQKPSIAITKMYSEAKYSAIKEQLKQIKDAKQNKANQNETETDSVIDYSAIDNVKYEIKNKIRNAIEFFKKAKSIASDYTKYLTISNNPDMALETLYTVYNVQDLELKTEIESIINNPISEN